MLLYTYCITGWNIVVFDCMCNTHKFRGTSNLNPFTFSKYLMLNTYVGSLIQRTGQVTTRAQTNSQRYWTHNRWGRDFPPFQTCPGTHLASCKMGTGSFPGVKCGRGVLLTTHLLLVPRSWKSRAIQPTRQVTRRAQTNSQRYWTHNRWGRDFPPFRTCPGAHPASCKMGTGSFPG